MKTCFYIFALLFTSGSFAQSNYEMVMDNPDPGVEFLNILPWGANQLVQTKTSMGPAPDFQPIYSLGKITNQVETALPIPSCTDLTLIPLFLDDGILVAGITPSAGVECVFYDGITPVEFDLNVGAGDSDPTISVLGDHVFIIAFDGNFRQLYEFDKVNHSVTKITNEAVDVTAASGVWGTDIFYSTQTNDPNTDREVLLRKAELSSGIYSYSTIHSVIFPVGVNAYVRWEKPLIKWGKLYFAENQVNFSQIAHSSIISIDQNDQYVNVYIGLQSPSFVIELCEVDNVLWAYGLDSYNLYKSDDGLTFTEVPNPAGKRYEYHQVSLNDKLYFVLYDSQNDNYEIAVNDGTLQTIHTGNHIHFSMEDNGALYLSDHESGNITSVIIVHTADDGVEEILIDIGEHSPTEDAAIIFDNAYTFLFSNPTGQTDVLKLTSSTSVSLDELSISFDAYPNPLPGGETLKIRTEVEGIANILTSDGKFIKQLNLSSGINEIETASLISGVYFISFQNRTQRVVVK